MTQSASAQRKGMRPVVRYQLTVDTGTVDGKRKQLRRRYRTEKEARAALGKSEEEIKQFSREGRLREFRDGPRLMFKADQVEQLKSDLGGGGGSDIGMSGSGSPIGLADSGGIGSGIGSGLGGIGSGIGTGIGSGRALRSVVVVVGADEVLVAAVVVVVAGGRA